MTNTKCTTQAMLGVRQKRARVINEMGLVTREGNNFRVSSPTQRRVEYRVWRDESGKVRCSCPDYEEISVATPGFRCEHILAVKTFLETNTIKETDEMRHTQELTVDEIAAEMEEAVEETREQTRQPHTEVAPPRGRVVPFAAILRELSRPIAPELIKRRVGWEDRQGNAHYIDYVEWHTVADLLDAVAPEWSHSVRDLKQIGDLVAVTAAITINGVTREGVGTGVAYTETGIKKAEHDALKRAAVKFGIARDLYKTLEEDSESRAGVTAADQSANFPVDPLAKSLDDLVTPRQLVAIRAIANAMQVDAEEECQRLLKCELKELNRRAASALIDYLKSLQNTSSAELRKAV